MGLRPGYICSQCLQAQKKRAALAVAPARARRAFSSALPLYSDGAVRKEKEEEGHNEGAEKKEEGAMSRRLAELAEETMETAGRSGRKVMEGAGFSEELKKQLEERITQSSFRSDNAAAFSQVDMPASAGKGTRDQAAAAAWCGTESVEDAALRMLTDSHKPLRTPFKIPSPTTGPLNLRPATKKTKQSTGERLINARDKASVYEAARDSAMTEKEREQIRKELKERFTPGARPMPTTLQGLASLASERIDDAIARGQFKNIPRGKGVNVERDHMADSPFLDTTSYLMNKIIQKQDIVPPWIEKQQEVIKEAQIFRKRLRHDWRRHAARMIASKGGSLEQQIRRAQVFAEAELKLNPKQAKVATLSAIDATGNLSQVTVEEKPPQPSTASSEATPRTIVVTEGDPMPPSPSPPSQTPPPLDPSQAPPPPLSSSNPLPILAPFRDPAWLTTESAYHTLAIASLNSLTRSYNLMAPKVAQKPYYSLPRELNACFADVAPQLPGEIERRARAPERIRVEVVGHRPGGVMEKFGAGESVKVWDERRPAYGLREFWRDLWRGEREGSAGRA